MLEQASSQLYGLADVCLRTLSGSEQDVDPGEAPVVHRQALDISAPDVGDADGVNGQARATGAAASAETWTLTGTTGVLIRSRH